MFDLDSIFFYSEIEASSSDELFEQVAFQLHEKGYVREDYAQALSEREGEFPTGLPLPGGIALPHTSADYVHRDAIVVVRLQSPIVFGEMGGDEEDKVNVSLAVFLVLSDASAHLSVLTSLIQSFQDEEFRSALLNAEERSSVQKIIYEKIS